MGKKSRKKQSKSPARQRPTSEAAAANATNAALVTSKQAPPPVQRPAPIVPKTSAVSSGASVATSASAVSAAATAVTVPVSVAPSVLAEAPAPAVAARVPNSNDNTNTSTNTNNNTNRMDATVTFEHLDIIQKYGGDSVDKSSAVVDMHADLKTADGNLSLLTSSNYASRFNPLKEAIWFSRKGSFINEAGQQQQQQQHDWTKCKTYMTVKTSASSLTTNLAILDLPPDVLVLPAGRNDDSVLPLKEFGNTLTDDMANAWFHITLEALYDLVEMDSDISLDSGERRSELIKRVASFVYKGSSDVLATAAPQAGLVTQTGAAPPRFSFGMILQVYLKLKELGANAELSQNDWDTMGIPVEDGAAVWLSLRKHAQLDLPGSVWWKVLFVLVLEFEPHLLRMNIHLLDSSQVTTFQDFLDECMEPPNQINGKFYKKMIQQVFSLQNVCLLTQPPRTGAMANVAETLRAIFKTGEGTVYDKDVIDGVATSSATAPVAAPFKEVAARVKEVTVEPPSSEITPKVPADPIATEAPADPVALPPSGPPPTPAKPPSSELSADPPAAKSAPVDAPGPNLAPKPKRVSDAAEAAAAAKAAEATHSADKDTKAEPDAEVELEPVPADSEPELVPSKPPVPSIRVLPPRPPSTAVRSPRTTAEMNAIPLEINAGLPTNAARSTADNYSLAGSMGAELNKEEALLDLMHQAATLCDSITTEKQVLLTRERRAGRNLQSAEANLKGVEAINKGLMKENTNQKDEIYKREDDINQLHVDAKHATRELSNLDTLNSQLQEQIENQTRDVDSLTKEKKDLAEDLETANATSESLEDALDVARKEIEALKAVVSSEQAGKAAVEHELSDMQQAKDAVELQLKETQGDLDSANDEIDRLEEIQADQQRLEADARKVAMEARRREFEAAEREAAESLQKAEDMRAAKSTARRTRKTTSSS